MKYAEIRQAYLDHLKEHNHAIIESASIIPEDNPTLLFVNSGMFPLIPYLLGESHPEGDRLANSQRCIRTIDIEEVGDRTHLTSFEMLGNWSLNDYFKEEAIPITLSYVVDKLGLPVENIYASVFGGEDDIPADDVATQVWKESFAKYNIQADVGQRERIQVFGKDECWWEVGDGGPCGPCTEIFYDTGADYCSDECSVACDCNKFIEIGNNVLMEYVKEGGKYAPLGRHNIDFGGGLERLACVVQGVSSVYETDIYEGVVNTVNGLASTKDETAVRIIVDHLKTATWMITEGVVPGKSEREYILRRLIRRAIRQAKSIGIDDMFTKIVAESIIESFSTVWELLEQRKDETIKVLQEEELQFNKTLKAGLTEVEKIAKEYTDRVFENSAGQSFNVYETYGFPPEMFIEELGNLGVTIDQDKFWSAHEQAFKEHQEKSRSASKGLFKGGLSDTSDASTQLHTATHLLLAALYRTQGDHIRQEGSNITPERLRLDFPADEKLSEETLREIEELVNEQIAANLPITWEEMDTQKALEIVPYAAFAERYGDKVKVYTIGEGEDPFSVEICRGPHVASTGELGNFKIVKQESVGAGVKRIKAILE